METEIGVTIDMLVDVVNLDDIPNAFFIAASDGIWDYVGGNSTVLFLGHLFVLNKYYCIDYYLVLDLRSSICHRTCLLPTSHIQVRGDSTVMVLLLAPLLSTRMLGF